MDDSRVLDEKGSEKINIKIRDANGNEKQFRMRFNAPLQKLMDAYSEHTDSPRDYFRFLFDGRRVEKTDTPRSLDMQDLDTIDALVYQTGGLVRQEVAAPTTE